MVVGIWDKVGKRLPCCWVNPILNLHSTTERKNSLISAVSLTTARQTNGQRKKVTDNYPQFCFQFTYRSSASSVLQIFNVKIGKLAKKQCWNWPPAIWYHGVTGPNESLLQSALEIPTWWGRQEKHVPPLPQVCLAVQKEPN